VTWWPCGKTWGGLGFGPQSYLVIHAFHRHSILFLILVSTSANEIEQTSWCSINSSYVLNILMIKNCFTFESKATNKVVSRLVMSSSPCWPSKLSACVRVDHTSERERVCVCGKLLIRSILVLLFSFEVP
jgi:hypothetical protein